MDLKQYKEMITKQLLDDVRKQVAKENQIANGDYKSQRNANQYNQIQNQINEPDVDELEGGKIHFLKHMNKIGKSIAHTAKHVAHDVNKVAHSKEMKAVGKFALDTGKEIGQAATSEVVKQGSKALGDFAVNSAKTFLAEAPGMAMEAAPLMLMAAGIPDKKPRKKRVVSDKEKRRHALVRELMNEHKCKLCEANAYIKQNNIDY